MLAIIPARGGSIRLPGKNIKHLLGKPLIAYTIEAALKSNLFSEVIVSTDSEEIAEIAEKFGANVPFIRPPHLATPTASSIDVLKHAIEFIETKSKQYYTEPIFLLQPTSPLRDQTDIINAYKVFLTPDTDSVVSVYPLEHKMSVFKRTENGYLKSFVNDELENETIFKLNGAIYITTRDLIFKHGVILGPKVRPYIMPFEKSIDIDNEYDFILAEYILKNR